MEIKTLELLIRHFDEAIKDIDFTHLPDRDSEEYRIFVMKTANDKMFCDGRYTITTEWTLEMFDRGDVRRALSDAKEINNLTDAQRMRLRFYLDLKKVCYPLFKGHEVDWTDWPWNMKDGSSSMFNDELWQFVCKGDYLCLNAAICYNMSKRVEANNQFYSSVAIHEISNYYYHGIDYAWDRHVSEDEKKLSELKKEIQKFADKVWVVENHALIGKQLRFDLLTQSVYDAMDTYIDKMYRSNQVDFARKLSTWIKRYYPIGDSDPSDYILIKFRNKYNELKKKYNVFSPDDSYTLNILVSDVLGKSILSEDEEYSSDDDDWYDE